MAVQNLNPITQGAEFLARGDIAGAERVASAMLARRDNDPDGLHLMGIVHIQQNRLDDAVMLLERSLAARPGHPHVLFNLGKVLALLGRREAAARALQDALLFQPSLIEAWIELAELQQSGGDFAAAETSLRKALALAPDHLLARLSLGVAIKNDGRPAEAEPVLAEGLAQARDPRLKAAFAYNLGFARYDQGKKAEALENFSEAKRFEPGRFSVDLTRADVLEELSRPEEAVALLQEVLRQEPGNALAHKSYNDLIYRLGRDEEFLKSYDRAPPSTELQAGKANFLLKVRRMEEAHAAFAAILARDPGDLNAAIGAASALNLMGRPAEAMPHLERARARHADHVPLHQHLAATALQARDPEKGAALAEQILRLAPVDHYGLALLGTAWRMLGDERDEMLNGYDDLIRVFDLEPPQGFSDMAQFNLALNDYLGGMHNTIREPVEQSLRGGTQTRGQIFGAGHELVEKLKARITQAMGRYIAGIRPDARHPFRGRKAADFRFTGSWSSRLRDCGYHANHIHPEGWISSCYYVGVPDAVKDGRQGWIKFGEPGFDAGVGIRHAIQPKPGRLVLFPSYMWHGTIPFQDAAPRTTIAFDAVPR